jgi:hypothetical protein
VATKTYYINELIDYSSTFSVVGTTDFPEALRNADSTKYIVINNEGSAFIEHTSNYRVAYDDPIPAGSTISSVALKVRFCQNKIDPIMDQALWGDITIGAQTNTDHFTLGTFVATNPPTAWEYSTLTLPVADSLSAWELGQFANGITVSLWAFGNGVGSYIFIDQFQLIVTYVPPTVTIVTPVVTLAWMNHFEVTGSTYITNGAVTFQAPLTCYFEWTAQDPDLETPNITYTSSIYNMESFVDSSKNPLYMVFVTLPDTFAFNNASTYLMTNKYYWIRLIVQHLGNTYTSDWLETKTLAADRIIL